VSDPITNPRATGLYWTSHPRIPLAIRRRLARWLVPRDGQRFCIEIAGRPYEGALDNYIEWVVFVTRAHFEYTYLNLIRRLVSGGTALDIGANVGNHTHALAAGFDEVLAFEPFPLAADRLAQKAAHLPNVTVHRVGLSDHADTLNFAPPTSANWGQGCIAAEGSLQVPVQVADEFLPGRHRTPINFIKIDVEGHELHVLRGLRQTLGRDRPVVFFEVPKSPGTPPGVPSLQRLFPPDYEFVGLRSQSTFPVQVTVARVMPLPTGKVRLPRRTTCVMAYGREREYVCRGGSLEKTRIKPVA
jgi:FkbM family methyltransferase